MKPLTAEEITELRRLDAKTSPGLSAAEWNALTTGLPRLLDEAERWRVLLPGHMEDAQAWWKRLNEVGVMDDPQRAVIEGVLRDLLRCRALLKRIEWSGFDEWYDSDEMRRADGGYCPECGVKKPGPHSHDCELAALLQP
jgi:hypothetical protein